MSTLTREEIEFITNAMPVYEDADSDLTWREQNILDLIQEGGSNPTHILAEIEKILTEGLEP